MEYRRRSALEPAPRCTPRWTAYCAAYAAAALAVLAWFTEPTRAAAWAIAALSSVGFSYALGYTAGLAWSAAAAVVAYLYYLTSASAYAYTALAVAGTAFLALYTRRPLALALLALPAGDPRLGPAIRLPLSLIATGGVALEARRIHALALLLYAFLMTFEEGDWGFLAAAALLASAPLVEGSLYEGRCPFRVEQGVFAVGAGLAGAGLVAALALNYAGHGNGVACRSEFVLDALRASWSVGFVLLESSILAPRGLGRALLREGEPVEARASIDEASIAY